jgi:hypothetical protein
MLRTCLLFASPLPTSDPSVGDVTVNDHILVDVVGSVKVVLPSFHSTFNCLTTCGDLLSGNAYEKVYAQY